MLALLVLIIFTVFAFKPNSFHERGIAFPWRIIKKNNNKPVPKGSAVIHSRLLRFYDLKEEHGSKANFEYICLLFTKSPNMSWREKLSLCFSFLDFFCTLGAFYEDSKIVSARKSVYKAPGFTLRVFAG